MADIDYTATPLTLSAVCFWDSDLRTIPTFVARMSQMARDACATLVLINALQGVSMRWGTSAPQAGSAIQVMLAGNRCFATC
jgi:hypothetical protein